MTSSSRFRSLRQTDALRAVLVLCASAAAILISSCSKDGPVAPQRYEYADVEDRTVALVNAHRSAIGLPQLATSDAITQEARAHSRNMADGTTAFGHDGFTTRVSHLRSVISFSTAAENVAWNQGFSDPAKTAVDAWLQSAGHKANIEGAFTLSGVGVAKGPDGAYYFTQIFVKTD